MANSLPPIPNDKIGESHVWREWFFNLGRFIAIAQVGGSPWTVPQGGTGVGSIVGYMKGNGVLPISATSSIPYSDISGAPVAGVLPIVTKTTAYTLTTADYTIRADATSAGFTLTLPLVPTNGRIYNVNKVDATANVVTINGNGFLINGQATMRIGRQYNAMMLQFDSVSSTWNIL
jgi:hypothetical protein